MFVNFLWYEAFSPLQDITRICKSSREGLAGRDWRFLFDGEWRVLTDTLWSHAEYGRAGYPSAREFIPASDAAPEGKIEVIKRREKI